MRIAALLLFVSAASGQPGDETGALLERARVALQQNRTEEAKTAAMAVLRQNPKSGDAELILGLVATGSRDLSAAEAHFSRAVQLQPANPRAYSYLGSTYLNLQRHAQAAQAFERVLKLEPGNTTAQYNLGLIAMRQKKPLVAARWFQTAATARPADLELLAALFQAQVAAGSRDDARRTAHRLSSAIPPGDPRLQEIGGLLAASGDSVGAVPVFEKAYRAAPTSAGAAYNLALALFRTARTAEALAVLRPFDRDAQALNLRGAIEESQGNYVQAKEAFDQAAALEPKNEHFRIDAAVARLREFDPQPAIRAFEAAAAEFPASLRVRIGLGSTYYLAGRFPDAARVLLEALTIDASAPIVYRLLSRTYEGAPEHGPSIEKAFQRYLRTKPRDAEAYSAYASMLLAKDASPAQVMTLLQDAIRQNPKLAEAHLQLGILSQNAGDLPKAIQSFEESARLSPQSSSVHYRLASAYARAGRVQDSRRAMEVFRELKSKEAEQQRDEVIAALTVP